MNILRLPLLRALTALLLAPVLRGDTDTPAAGRRLYVTINTFDPQVRPTALRAFQPGEIVLSTLKATAAASANLPDWRTRC